jgi:hypothetical protein
MTTIYGNRVQSTVQVTTATDWTKKYDFLHSLFLYSVIVLEAVAKIWLANLNQSWPLC